MKFLHTADWQIGMKAGPAGSASRNVREERMAAGQRLIEAAHEHGAECILAAGDLFEDNAVDRTLVQQTADLLSQFRGPVYLIPGNHDPLVPGCVWDHPAWRRAENLVVLREAEPLEVPGGMLYPCPVRDRHSRKDPTAWITGARGDEIRLGLAHGNVEGLPQADPDHPIARDAADRAGLDYLALGHWHSTAVFPDAEGVTRMAYSGTHETTRFGERESGYALLVEISAPGAAPEVTPVRTGRLRWEILSREMNAPGDLQGLLRDLESVIDPDAVLLDLRLAGLLYSDEMEALRTVEDLLAARFLYARLDAAELRPAPEDDQWIQALPAGILREAAGRLQQKSLSGGHDAEPAARALLELYRIANEVGR